MNSMRILLDTHTFIWWLVDDIRLSRIARESISDPENEIFVSSASAWEIATKYRLGKLPNVRAMVNDISRCITDQGFKDLSITVDDGQRAGLLRNKLRDPFDRMLIAQSQSRNLVIITKNSQIHQYHGNVLW